jgi:hypothetical protein
MPDKVYLLYSKEMCDNEEKIIDMKHQLGYYANHLEKVLRLKNI